MLKVNLDVTILKCRVWSIFILDLVIFVFFAYKKYSCSFVTLWLNHWCHMDYFNNVLTTFLGIERVSYVAVYAGSESRVKKKTCFPKMIEGLAGLERHEGEQ